MNLTMKSFVIISDKLTHDKHTVTALKKKKTIIEINKAFKIRRIHGFSDGAGANSKTVFHYRTL